LRLTPAERANWRRGVGDSEEDGRAIL
jgi:hypothetical protein